MLWLRLAATTALLTTTTWAAPFDAKKFLGELCADAQRFTVELKVDLPVAPDTSDPTPRGGAMLWLDRSRAVVDSYLQKYVEIADWTASTDRVVAELRNEEGTPILLIAADVRAGDVALLLDKLRAAGVERVTVSYRQASPLNRPAHLSQRSTNDFAPPPATRRPASRSWPPGGRWRRVRARA